MLRVRRVAALCMGGWVFTVGVADAETYRLVEGALEDADGGASEPLRGRLEISLFVPEAQDARPSLLVDDFQLEAGARSFGPQQPVEFEGRAPIWIQIADQIQFDGDAVGLVHLRSGGELIAADESEMVFRFMDFRSDGSGESRLVGHLGDSLLPRRISLSGTLTEVDQHFVLPRGECPILPLPPGGGGVVIGGGASTIDGTLQTTGALELLTPSGVVFGATSTETSRALVTAMGIPTLAELGITAPSGAEVAFDETGALTVSSQGDLVVAAGAIELPGLTSLSLIALGSITIEGALGLPPGVSLTLQSGAVVVDGGIPAPGDIVLDAPSALDFPFCTAMRAVFPPEEREIGHFTLVASAAQQVEVVLEPRRRREGSHSDRHRFVAAAILGSRDFDVRDVDEGSLRFGPGEAEPERRRGRGRGGRIDVDHDGEIDLVVHFDAREACIAPGVSEVCLFGETRDGIAIEGCDAIETRRRHHRGGRGAAPTDQRCSQ